MIGIFLIAIGEVFSQVGISIGKYQVSLKKESLYAMAFLHSFWAALLLILFTISGKGEFIFSIQSLPTLLVRVLFEIILVFVALKAVVDADRSTYSFLRVITLPLLLVVDVSLGYDISLMQITGVSLVVVALIFLFINHGLSKRGKMFSVFSALLAVATISLYKYNITHFNSVEAEQIITHVILLLVIVVAAWVHTKENVFALLKNRTFFTQSLASGIGGVFLSFAYVYAPASVITTAKRSLEILTSMIFGKSYFHEKHFLIKLAALVLIILGIKFIVG